MKNHKKPAIITFKADAALAEALQAVPNKSAFIRAAILTALDNGCPLCQGTGILTQEQKKHWGDFLSTHSVTTCEDCKAVHLVCQADSAQCRH